MKTIRTLHFAKGGVIEALDEAKRQARSVSFSGIDSLGVLRQNLMIARGFKPMAPEEMQALRQRCKSFAADGQPRAV